MMIALISSILLGTTLILALAFGAVSMLSRWGTGYRPARPRSGRHGVHPL